MTRKESLFEAIVLDFALLLPAGFLILGPIWLLGIAFSPPMWILVMVFIPWSIAGGILFADIRRNLMRRWDAWRVCKSSARSESKATDSK